MLQRPAEGAGREVALEYMQGAHAALLHAGCDMSMGEQEPAVAQLAAAIRTAMAKKADIDEKQAAIVQAQIVACAADSGAAGFCDPPPARVPPWVADKLTFFAEQIKAGNLTNQLALADELLKLRTEAPTASTAAGPATNLCEGVQGAQDGMEGVTAEEARTTWSTVPGNRRRMTSKHIVETPQVGQSGSILAPTGA